MDTPKQPSPLTLALRAVAGIALLLGTIVVMMVIPASRLRSSGTEPCSDSGCVCGALLSPIFITFLALLTVGAVIAWRAEKRLERGVRDQLWRDDELEPLRKWVDHPSTKVLVFLPIVGWAVGMIAERHSGLMGMLYCFLLPTIARARISSFLRPVRHSEMQDWRTWKRFQSEHWGEGRGVGEDSVPG